MNHKSTKKKILIVAALCVVLASGLFLRLHELDRYSLWYDESISVLTAWGFSKMPHIAQMFDHDFMVKNHDYLSLYTVIFVHYWQKLSGQSEYGLRLSSVIFALLSLCLLYVIAKRMLGYKTALIATILLAFSPFHLHYSQELRPYAGAAFFTLLSVYALDGLIEGKIKHFWLLYAFSIILGSYFHYTTLLTALSLLLFLIVKFKREKKMLFETAIVHLVIFFCLAPLLINSYHNLIFLLNHRISAMTSEFPIWTDKFMPQQILYMFKNFTAGYNADYYSLFGKITTFSYLGFFVLGMIKAWKGIRMRLALFCFISSLSFIIFISILQHCFVYRYAFSVFPICFIIVAEGIGSLRKHFLIPVVAGAILVSTVNLCAYFINHLSPDNWMQYVGVGERQNIKDAVRFLISGYRNGDRIMHICKNSVFPFKLYLRLEKATPALINEIDKGRVIQSFDGRDLLICEYDRLYPLSYLREDYKALDINDLTRIWVVFSDWKFHSQGKKKDYAGLEKIKNSFRLVKMERFFDAELFLFERLPNY